MNLVASNRQCREVSPVLLRNLVASHRQCLEVSPVLLRNLVARVVSRDTDRGPIPEVSMIPDKNSSLLSSSHILSKFEMYEGSFDGLRELL